MPTYPFRRPMAPLHVPLWARLKAWVQIAAERALPPRWLFAFSAMSLLFADAGTLDH